MKTRLFHSLKSKTAFTLFMIALIISAAAAIFSYRNYEENLGNQLLNTATNIAKTIAAQVDPSSIDKYLESGKTDANYDKTLENIRKIVDNNNVVYSVVTKPTEEGFYYIYDSDRSDEAFVLGDFQEFYPGDFLDNKANFLAGNEIPPIESDYEFGHLLSVLVPIKDANGKMCAYVDVDMSMNEIISIRNNFLYTLCTLLLSIAVVIAIISLFAVNKFFVKPVNTLADAAADFISNQQIESIDAPRNIIEIPELQTGDEIERLYDSIRKMELDIYEYIDNIKTATADKERIRAELDVANTIQRSMLPSLFPPFPDRKEFDIFASMNPAKEVGGDFYDFYLIDSDHIALTIADVSGKGVAAALFMSISKVLLQNCLKEGNTPDGTLEYVNNLLCVNNEAGMFVTVWVGVLEISTGRMICANAGHEYPAVRKAGGSFEIIRDKHGFVLAGMENCKYKAYEIQLEKGDTLYVYTDGVTEATNIKNELFGEERMLESLNKYTEYDPKSLSLAIKADIDQFVGEAPQFDDITMLALKYNGPIKE